jgi:hypothetical protein
MMLASDGSRRGCLGLLAVTSASSFGHSPRLKAKALRLKSEPFWPVLPPRT